jgi:hypothetical protein
MARSSQTKYIQIADGADFWPYFSHFGAHTFCTLPSNLRVLAFSLNFLF